MTMKKIFIFVILLQVICLQYYGPDLFYSAYDQIQLPQQNYLQIYQFVASALNITYLNPTTTKFKKMVRGVVWGYKGRSFISLPVRVARKNCTSSLQVIFKVDTGSHYSTISKKAKQRLKKQCNISQQLYQPVRMWINNKLTEVMESSSNHMEANIIGYDYLKQNNINLEVDYQESSVLLEFDANIYEQEQL